MCCLNYFHLKGLQCEQKVNVCFNKTCSFNGRCYDNATVPTCKCFKFYSGDDCEIKSEVLKKMKQDTAIISIIASTVLAGFLGAVTCSFFHIIVMRIFFP